MINIDHRIILLLTSVPVSKFGGRLTVVELFTGSGDIVVDVGDD